MAIYRKGEASLAADGTVTGYGTNWKDQLALVRIGATVVFLNGNAIGAIGTVSAIVSETQLQTIQTDGAVVARGKYFILLHDSLTVDGLAQNVAETLRYYQSQETEIADAVDYFRTFDWEKFEKIATSVKSNAAAAKVSETNAKTSENNSKASEKAAESSKNAAAASQGEAKTSENNAKTSENNSKASENAANGSKVAAAGSATAADNSAKAGAASQAAAKTSEQNSKASEQNAKASENASLQNKNASAGSATAAKTSENNAKASEGKAKTSETNSATNAAKSTEEADRAKREADRAAAANPDNSLLKANNLSDVPNKEIALRNLEGFSLKRSSLSASDNLNNISGLDKAGIYYNASNSNATEGNNYPIVQAGVLMVTGCQANGSNQTQQYYYPFASPDVYYVRHLNLTNGSWVWTAWDMRESSSKLRDDTGMNTTGVLGPINANDIKKNCFFAGAGNGSSNYKMPYSGGIAIRRVNSVAQMQIDGGNGDIWTRASADGSAWTEWRAVAMLQSSPTFTGGSISVDGAGKTVRIGAGGSDAYLANLKSNKYLQLKDDGSLQYDSKIVMHDGLDYTGAVYDVSLRTFRIKANGNNLHLMSTTDSNPQVFHAGYNLSGTRLFWMGCGSSDGSVTIHRDVTGNSLALKSDGHVQANTQGNNKDFIVQGAKVRVLHGSGRSMFFGNDGNSSQDGNLRLWGNTAGRPSVLEFSLSSGWVFYAQLNGDNSRVLNVNGNVQCNQVIQGSDRDLKDNVSVICNATESIRKMSGYTYSMKEDGMPCAGVIAQEVMEAIPEAINGITKLVDLPGPTVDGSALRGEDRYLGVDYSAVTGLLVQVCRESDERITKLESEVEELKSLVSELLKAR